jgi:hypothetical protein
MCHSLSVGGPLEVLLYVKSIIPITQSCMVSSHHYLHTEDHTKFVDIVFIMYAHSSYSDIPNFNHSLTNS